MGIGNFHLHRATGSRGVKSPNMKAWAKVVGHGLRASGARVLCGDANKAVFLISALMHDVGLLVQLVAHHREFSFNERVNLCSREGILAALRSDTCGIWIVGGVTTVRSLHIETQVEHGALHPAFLERHKGVFKCFQRGFASGSLDLPPGGEAGTESLRASEVPSDECVDTVVRAWNAHGMTPVGKQPGGQWRWDLDPREETVEDWKEVAEILPKPGEQWQVISWTCVAIEGSVALLARSLNQSCWQIHPS